MTQHAREARRAGGTAPARAPHRSGSRAAPTLPPPGPRILVLGLGTPDEGNHGIGGRLAHSLGRRVRGARVKSTNEFVSYAQVFHDYDLIVLLNAIAFCSDVGNVSLGSPLGLLDAWGFPATQAEAFEHALSYARLMGQRIPRIKVVNVCVGTEDNRSGGLSPAVAAVYRDILGRVRNVVREAIREEQGNGRGVTPPS